MKEVNNPQKNEAMQEKEIEEVAENFRISL